MAAKFQYQQKIVKQSIEDVSFDQLKNILSSTFNVRVHSISGFITKQQLKGIEELKSCLLDNKSKFSINKVQINSKNIVSEIQTNQLDNYLTDMPKFQPHKSMVNQQGQSENNNKQGQNCERCNCSIKMDDFIFIKMIKDERQNKILCFSCAKKDNSILYPSMLCRYYKKYVKQKSAIRHCALLLNSGILSPEGIQSIKSNKAQDDKQISQQQLIIKQKQIDEQIFKKCQEKMGKLKYNKKFCEQIRTDIQNYEGRYKLSVDQVSSRILGVENSNP